MRDVGTYIKTWNIFVPLHFVNSLTLALRRRRENAENFKNTLDFTVVLFRVNLRFR